MRTLYEILEVQESATQEQIKDAYRRLAMKWHPDRNDANREEAAEKFKEIGAAYRVLSDPEQRREYDEQLHSERERFTQETSNNEEDMSGDDAQTLFFESMLELALDIAARGYNETTIADALIGLNCPRSVAEVVSKLAVRLKARETRSAQTPDEETQQKVEIASVENANWDQLEPYYAAVIGGEYAAARVTENEYQALKRKAFVHRLGFYGGALCILAGGLMASYSSRSINELRYLSAGLLICGFILTVVIIVRRWYGEKYAAWRDETAIRYYLKKFRALHEHKLISFNFNAFFLGLLWFAHRRLSVFAFIGCVLLVSVEWISVLIANISLEVALAVQAIGYLVYLLALFCFGFLANRLYLRSVRKKIKAVLTSPKDQALLQLYQSGGTKPWLPFVALAFLIILGVPASTMLEAKVQEDIAARAAAAAAAEENRKLRALEIELIRQYPQLDSQSPEYSQELVDELLDRKDAYVQEGESPSNALRKAISDMTR